MKKSAKSRSLWQRKYINLWRWRSAGDLRDYFLQRIRTGVRLKNLQAQAFFILSLRCGRLRTWKRKWPDAPSPVGSSPPSRIAALKDYKGCDVRAAGVRHASGAVDRGAHAGGTHAGSPADPGDAGRREKAAVKRAFCSGHTGKRAGAALFFTVPSGP